MTSPRETPQIPPQDPQNWPKIGPEKSQIFVPTGRVIKYPKKCALFCPPGGPPRGPPWGLYGGYRGVPPISK